MNRKFIKNSNLILRKILHSNECVDILKDLIQSIVKIKIKKIIINDNTLQIYKTNKEYGIVDVRATTEENEEVNIGIQIIDGDYIQNKMFLYYAKIHSNQVLYGDNRKVARTITINILDMSYFNSIQYHRIIKIRTNILNDNILETMELHVLELPKYTIDLTERITTKDAWMLYLKGKDAYTIKQAKIRNEKVNKLDDLINDYWKKEKI